MTTKSLRGNKNIDMTAKSVRDNIRWNQQLEARYQTIMDHSLLLEFLNQAGPDKPNTSDPLDPQMSDWGTDELLNLLEKVTPSPESIRKAGGMYER